MQIQAAHRAPWWYEHSHTSTPKRWKRNLVLILQGWTPRLPSSSLPTKDNLLFYILCTEELRDLIERHVLAKQNGKEKS